MEKNNQMNFIITEDKDTADELLKLGFQAVINTGDSWLFLNDNNKLMFAGDKNLKYTFTNTMMI